MKTKIQMRNCGPAGPVYFSDLEIGDWYDSHSTYGVCIKTGMESFYSLAHNMLVAGQRVSNCWECTRLNVAIKYREAA